MNAFTFIHESRATLSHTSQFKVLRSEYSKSCYHIILSNHQNSYLFLKPLNLKSTLFFANKLKPIPSVSSYRRPFFSTHFSTWHWALLGHNGPVQAVIVFLASFACQTAKVFHNDTPTFLSIQKALCNTAVVLSALQLMLILSWTSELASGVLPYNGFILSIKQVSLHPGWQPLLHWPFCSVGCLKAESYILNSTWTHHKQTNMSCVFYLERITSFRPLGSDLSRTSIKMTQRLAQNPQNQPDERKPENNPLVYREPDYARLFVT